MTTKSTHEDTTRLGVTWYGVVLNHHRVGAHGARGLRSASWAAHISKSAAICAPSRVQRIGAMRPLSVAGTRRSRHLLLCRPSLVAPAHNVAMNADAGVPGPSSTVQCRSLGRFCPSKLAPREPTVLQRALVGNGKNVPGKDPRRDPQDRTLGQSVRSPLSDVKSPRSGRPALQPMTRSSDGCRDRQPCYVGHKLGRPSRESKLHGPGTPPEEARRHPVG